MEVFSFAKVDFGLYSVYTMKRARRASSSNQLVECWTSWLEERSFIVLLLQSYIVFSGFYPYTWWAQLAPSDK